MEAMITRVLSARRVHLPLRTLLVPQSIRPLKPRIRCVLILNEIKNNNSKKKNAVCSSRGFVVSFRDKTDFERDSSHSAIKDAYFYFGLCGYNINTLLPHHVASLPGGVIQSTGDLSPENTEISPFQPAPL